MRDVEPQRRAERVLLILRAEHSLRHVSAAARLCARIPRQPPLHSEINDEGENRQSPKRIRSQPKMKVRQKCDWICGLHPGRADVILDHLQMHLQGLHPANLCHGNPGQHDNHRHLQSKLKQVGDQHAPESADKCV